MPGLLFCLFSFIKIAVYDEPWAFKPWASGLAEFLFLFVCLGGVFPLLSQKVKEKQEFAGCCESTADLWPSKDQGGPGVFPRFIWGTP